MKNKKTLPLKLALLSLGIAATSNAQPCGQSWQMLQPWASYVSTSQPAAEPILWPTVNTPRDDWRSVASSATGQHLAAAAQYKPLLLSHDFGQTWQSSPDAPSNVWAVAINEDGQRLATVARGGNLHISHNGGQTWQATEAPRQWYNVTMDAKGQNMLAAVEG
ncbi:MAG: hypothetical protein EBQ80_01270, partial [Proteobacteria bacterium]|nr:hypothetical protein [Pseudomonadota bacterium]